MVLSDKEILQAILKDDLIISPISNPKQIGSSSVDIRLGTSFKYFKLIRQTHFDLTNIERLAEEIKDYSEEVKLGSSEPFILHPKDFVLGSTLEYLKLPNNLTARLEGRSTWGRVGLQIHSTAGLVDPGFKGSLTFELHNLGKLPLPLFPGVRIGQLVFYPIDKVGVDYSKKSQAKYHSQLGPKNSSFYSDYDFQNIVNKYKDERNK
ncbi:dCTP deaminase [Xanthomarina gelatinilytica]|uniref:dCTP deaminase n=1 Tax=Xanthomarina gelatinilytica TaxID=1137281 RepID=UPI003AA7E28D